MAHVIPGIFLGIQPVCETLSFKFFVCFFCFVFCSFWGVLILHTFLHKNNSSNLLSSTTINPTAGSQTNCLSALKGGKVGI